MPACQAEFLQICLIECRFFGCVSEEMSQLCCYSVCADTCISVLNDVALVPAHLPHTQDNHTRAWLTFILTSRWLGARLDLIVFLLVVVWCCEWRATAANLLARWKGSEGVWKKMMDFFYSKTWGGERQSVSVALVAECQKNTILKTPFKK